MAAKIGQKYNRLTIINEVPKTDRKDKWIREYYCQCDCGNTCRVRSDYILSGHTKSCGCSRVKFKHGQTGSRLYRVWSGIKKRCFNKNCEDYHNYGGRGISICKEWMIFENFSSWAINHGYKKGLTIERINVNGNYEPENCKWITRQEQCMNTRQTKYISYHGERKTLKDWAEIIGIKYDVLLLRLSRGWTPEEVLTLPLGIKIRNVKIFTAHNKSLTLKEWSQKLNINESTLRARLRYGWSVEKTLMTKLQK